jgi:anti-anti-sigma regulatory factor
MMLRITRENTEWGAITLKVEGRLVQELADLLEQECSTLRPFSDGLTLDLSGVTFVDRCGVQALKRLHGAGCVIRGCSDLVASILEVEGIRVDCGGGPPPP